MSRRRGTKAERERKKWLFKGQIERTRLAHHVDVCLSARHNGKGNYIVGMIFELPARADGRKQFRTLAEADAYIAKVVREDAIKAALVALGVA